jgi:hypothetical protein
MPAQPLVNCADIKLVSAWWQPLERWQDVDQEVVADSKRVEHVAKG